jgi:CheY-like chemotaxis protein
MKASLSAGARIARDAAHIETDPPRIMVVEDEALIRDVLSEILNDLGASVAEACNADEAWDFLAAGSHFDLVFTDNSMPGSMTGIELAQRIRAEYPEVDVVVVSGDWRLLSWTEPVLAKPYPLDETAAELARRALSARRRH